MSPEPGRALARIVFGAAIGMVTRNRIRLHFAPIEMA
jgi:hypothetical protein